MAPRSLGEIISELTYSDEDEKNIVDNFIKLLEEIYSHPKEEINKMLIQIKDSAIVQIREDVFLRCLDEIPAEQVQEKKHKSIRSFMQST